MRSTALLSILFLCVFPTHAQVDQGTITGTVTDPTGAVVPNVEVTLANADTGLVLKSTSNQSGVYVFSPVKIGNYSVTASAPGFLRLAQVHFAPVGRQFNTLDFRAHDRFAACGF